MSDPLQPEPIDEDRRRQFERAWIRGKAAPLEDFLPPQDDSRFLGTLEELIHIEIEMAWKQCFANATGPPEDDSATVEQPPTVESYVARYKQLNSPEIILRLLKQECLVRKQFDVPLNLETCQARFPQLSLDRIEMAPLLEKAQQSDSDIPGATISPDCIDGTLLTLPFTFGDFELLEQLGRGGMGIVYRARQLSVPRIVAVKILRSYFADCSSSDVTERFQREIRATTKLQHDNIVRVFDVGQINGQSFFSMQYICGRSLGRIIAQRPLDNRLAATYLEKIARAIAFAHRAGILHRDLKPDNILVEDDSERPLVLDFGLAKLSDRPDALTSTGKTFGTPSYMAPEQARDASKATQQSDIYALGATLYAVLCGRPPFSASSTSETLRQLIEEDPTPPRHLNIDIDWDLQTICMKCLRKNPFHRYDTADDLADDLKCYLEGKTIQARRAGVFSEIRKQWRRDPRPLTTTIIISTIVLILVALGAIRYSRVLALRGTSHKQLQEARSIVDSFSQELYDEEQKQSVIRRENYQPLYDRLLNYYQSIITKSDSDHRLRKHLATAYYQKGRIEVSQGDIPTALNSFLAAVEIQRQHVKRDANNNTLKYQLSEYLESVGHGLAQTGNIQASTDAYREVAGLRKRLASSSPSNLLYQKKYASSLAAIGILKQEQQHFKLAREHLHEAEKEFLTLLKQWPDDPGIHTALGTCYYNLAQLDLLDGKSSAYYEYLDKAATEFQTYFDGSEKNLDIKYIGLMVNVCHDMGNSYLHDQQPDHALSWYEKGESAHKLLPSDIATTDTYDARIADLYARWSDALRTAGQITEAITQCKRSLTNWKKLIVLHPDTSMYSRNYAVTLGRLARIQMELNDRRSAKENLLKAKRELSRLVQAHPGQSEFQAPLHEILVFLHQIEQ